MLGLTDTVNLGNMRERICAGIVDGRVRARCGSGKVLVLAGVTHKDILWVVGRGDNSGGDRVGLAQREVAVIVWHVDVVIAVFFHVVDAGTGIGLRHPLLGLLRLQKLVERQLDSWPHYAETGRAATADAFAITHGVGERRGRIEKGGGPKGAAEKSWEMEFFE